MKAFNQTKVCNHGFGICAIGTRNIKVSKPIFIDFKFEKRKSSFTGSISYFGILNLIWYFAIHCRCRPVFETLHQIILISSRHEVVTQYYMLGALVFGSLGPTEPWSRLQVLFEELGLTPSKSLTLLVVEFCRSKSAWSNESQKDFQYCFTILFCYYVVPSLKTLDK